MGQNCNCERQGTADVQFDVTSSISTSVNSKRVAFDISLSTEENYGKAHFSGPHKDIRPLLDYTYHRKYTAERVKVQDDIIDGLIVGKHLCAHEMMPWVIFTAGAMGAGKGYVMKWMNKNGHLPLQDVVIVDPDQIRQLLPEWEAYVKHDAESAGDKTQKEAGCIAEILGYLALRNRKHVIFDGSLRDYAWYKGYFRKLREHFPGIRIMIIHIEADRDEVLRRAEERGKRTGRMVPKETLLQSMEAVPKSVRKLAEHADFVCKVRNTSDKEPQLLREEGAPHPPASVTLTWDIMKTLWKAIDLDGDGELTSQEVSIGIANGSLTQVAIDSLDKNKDGHISKEEMRAALSAARSSGAVQWR